MKLNFTAAISILLHLVHCESIGSSQHLYVQGEFVCYQWWQYLILAVVIPTFFLFPLSFGVSLDLLKDRVISTSTFVLSCATPFTAFCFYFKGKMFQLCKRKPSIEEEKCINEILEQEETLFNADDSSMRWTVVQLYRNLLVVLLNIFILNPVFKSLWFSALFVAFCLHDWYRTPFKHPYLNLLQRLTSVCLFFVNLCSVPASFISSVGNNMAIPNMKKCLLVLRYFEMVLFIVVPMSLPLWTLWGRWKQRKVEGKAKVTM